MTELKKKLFTKRNILILVILLILASASIWFIVFNNQKSNDDSNTDNSSKNINKTEQKSQEMTIGEVKISGKSDCTIPNKVVMTDFFGYSLSDITAKYGGVSQLNPKYSSQVITCENDNYFIRINFTDSKMIADYIEIQEKEFGTCESGIDNVLPWVDKSMRAVGLDPTTKGVATYDTEDYRSQIEYDHYMIDGKDTYLTVECNISGDYIGVLAVLAD